MDGFEKYPHLQANLYERPDHYAGATFGGTATLYGRHRDSDLLTESNWDYILEQFTDEDSVFVTSASHWLVGWVESIRLRPDASDEVKAKAEKILADLEDYPVLDESDFSEREFNAGLEYWDGWSKDPNKPDISHRVSIIKWWNDKHRGHWQKSIPIVAARHSMHTLSERYPDFEQWVMEVGRE